MNGNETRALDAANTVGLSTFAVDTRDRCTQAVAPTYACEPDGRFYVVEAHGGREALQIALAARSLGCHTIAAYRAKLATRLADPDTAPVMACDALPNDLVERAAQTRRQVVVLLCGSATPMLDLRRLEDFRGKLAELNVEVVTATEETLAKSQIERDMIVLEALGAQRGIVELLGPAISPLEELTQLVDAPANDRPAWVSPYGPARRRR